MVEDAKNLVPLFKRLNHDFWVCSIQPRYLPNFIKIMENYSRKLKEQNKSEKDFVMLLFINC